MSYIIVGLRGKRPEGVIYSISTLGEGNEAEEDSEKWRVRSSSEDNKSTIFRLSEASRDSSRVGFMKTPHDSVEVAEISTENAVSSVSASHILGSRPLIRVYVPLSGDTY